MNKDLELREYYNTLYLVPKDEKSTKRGIPVDYLPKELFNEIDFDGIYKNVKGRLNKSAVRQNGLPTKQTLVQTIVAETIREVNRVLESSKE